MCQFSATAENMRDARQGEVLTVSRAPHGEGNWLTEPGKPDCAVCIRHNAILAVRVSDVVRRAYFEQRGVRDKNGNVDFLVYIDGEQASVPLNELSLDTTAHVLCLYYDGGRLPEIPAEIARERAEEEVELCA